MRILILEDNTYRLEKFKQMFIGCTLDITKDPNEANKWLQIQTYDYIFLDHDLEDYHYPEDCMSKESTGLNTAIFIGQNKHLSPNAKIYIHSLNPAGVKRMQLAINRNVHTIPFYNLFK